MKRFSFISLCLCLFIFSLSGNLAFADTSLPEYAYISEMEWITSRSYKDGTIGDFACRDTNNAGEEIMICYEVFNHGVSLHAISGSDSYVTVDLTDKGYTRFGAFIGLSQSSAYDVSMGSVRFKIYGDNKLLYSSDIMRFEDDAVLVDVDITGVKTLKLCINDAGDNIYGDWGVYANALVSKSDKAGNLVDPTVPPRITQAPTQEPTPAPSYTPTPLPDNSSTSGDDVIIAITITITCAVVIATVFIIIKLLKKKK